MHFFVEARYLTWKGRPLFEWGWGRPNKIHVDVKRVDIIRIC
jgi:hypothetical protein